MVEMFGVLQETIMVHILQKFSVIFLSKLGKFVKVQGTLRSSYKRSAKYKLTPVDGFSILKGSFIILGM